jgi:hypothetical protein
LREALRFGWVAPGDLMVASALALLLIAPAELSKALASSTVPLPVRRQ